MEALGVIVITVVVGMLVMLIVAGCLLAAAKSGEDGEL